MYGEEAGGPVRQRAPKPDGGRGRRIGVALAASLLLAGTLLAPAGRAQLTGLGLALTVDPMVTVGETGNQGSFTIRNVSDPATSPITVTEITVVPCADVISPGTNPCVFPESDDIVVTSAVGTGGECAGRTFTVTGPDANGRYVLLPDAPIVLEAPPAAGQAGELCDIAFTFDVVGPPENDAVPAEPGTQIRFVVTARGTTADGLTLGAFGTDLTTISRATTTLVTDASPPPDGTVPLGTAVTDTVTITGVAGGPTPTGTVTFFLYGPNDPTCAGTPLFTNFVPPGGSPLAPTGPATATATSDAFVVTFPGTYNFTATYSGDPNYLPITTQVGCGDPNERFSVQQLQPTVATVASTQTATPGTAVVDTVTVTGQPGFPAPTGTVTFTLYGPGDPTCTTPIFVNFNVPLAPGGGTTSTATSEPFIAFAPGTYNFTATYSGDAIYAPAGPVGCGDAAEQFVLNLFQPTVVTVATAATSGAPGAPATDTATVSGPPGSPTPTGTVVFTLVGPFATPPTPAGGCAGAPTFGTSPPVPLVNGQATSPAFSPTAPGTYNFIATYSGDANFAASGPVGCGVFAEQFTVALAGPTVVTQVSAPSTELGSPITDTATLAGGNAPTGTIRFFVYGPNDVNCTGPAFEITPILPVAGNGSYTSGPFTPTAVGSYRFIAAYSGDANNAPVTTLCNDPNETAEVVAATLEIVTVAAPAIVTLGQPVTDTATLAGGVNPTGTLVFQLFGPDNATCTGPPAFTSLPIPVAGNGSYISPPFTPTAPGTYRFTVNYSGDANNFPLSTPCNAPNENVTVTGLADLSLTKACDPGPVVPGAVFGCSVTVSNAGPSTAQNVSVSDDLPSGVVLVSTPSGDGFTCLGADPFTCTLPSLAPSASATFAFAVRAENIGPGTPLINTATVSSSTPDPNATNNAATATTSVIACTITGAGDIFGTEGNDVICGSIGRDRIAGLGGDDVIFGLAGDDQISGGAGNDVVSGGDGNDDLAGGAGNDRLFGNGGGVDRLSGGAGDDYLNTVDGSGDDFAVGGHHVIGDTCVVEPGDSTALCEGSTSNTTLLTPTTVAPTTTTSTTSTTSTVPPTSTTTTTTVPPTTTTTTVGTGAVLCNGLVATMVGAPGSDTILGTQGRDIIAGLGGSDRIIGGGGDDVICGGDGNDVLVGGDGNDELFAGNGNDVLDGGAGNDRLFGEAGSDIIGGRDGDDMLNGGTGSDFCGGGDGADNATACELLQAVP